MKQYILALCLCAGIFLPALASAHQTNTYTINGHTYAFTVGSLGEPLVVDDKSGIDLAIKRDGEVFVGAEEKLKVEAISGKTKRVYDLTVVWGVEGRYDTTFFVTSSDTLSYRLFGELEGKVVDITFTCMPSGHTMHAEELKKDIPISDGVMQTATRGSFGCPAPKAEFEFPRKTGDQSWLSRKINLGLALSASALALATLNFVLARRRKEH